MIFPYVSSFPVLREYPQWTFPSIKECLPLHVYGEEMYLPVGGAVHYPT